MPRIASAYKLTLNGSVALALSTVNNSNKCTIKSSNQLILDLYNHEQGNQLCCLSNLLYLEEIDGKISLLTITHADRGLRCLCVFNDEGRFGALRFKYLCRVDVWDMTSGSF